MLVFTLKPTILLRSVTNAFINEQINPVAREKSSTIVRKYDDLHEDFLCYGPKYHSELNQIMHWK